MLYNSDDELMYNQPDDAYKSPEECLEKSCIYIEEEGGTAEQFTLPPLQCPGVSSMYIVMADTVRTVRLWEEVVASDILVESIWQDYIQFSTFLVSCLDSETRSVYVKQPSQSTTEGQVKLLYDVNASPHFQNRPSRVSEVGGTGDTTSYTSAAHLRPVLVLPYSMPKIAHYQPESVPSDDGRLLAAIMATFQASMARNTVRAKVNYCQCIALVDTGAISSCMSEAFFTRVLKKKKVYLDTSRARKLHDASGNNMHVLGTVECDFEVAGLRTSLACQVVSGLAVDVILGIPFLQENRAHIDCETGKVTFHDGLVAALLRKGVEWESTYPLTPIDSVWVSPHTLAKIPCRAPKGSFQACFAYKYIEHWPLESKLDTEHRQSVLTTTQPQYKHPTPIATDWDIDTLFEDETCCITVINTSSEPMFIPNKVPIGHCEPFDVSRMLDVEGDGGMFSVTETDEHSAQTNITVSPGLENDEIFSAKAVILEPEETIPIEYEPIQWREILDLSHLTETQITQLIELLERNRPCFAVNTKELGVITHVQHQIKLKHGAKPFRQRPYRMNLDGQQEMERQIKQMLEQNIIEHSHENQYCSAAFLVRKKDLGPDQKPNWRCVVDFRRLNSQCVEEFYPLPTFEQLADNISETKASIFSTVDLAHGYFQLKVHPDSRHLTTFTTGRGTYQWCRMPMGLGAAPASFGRAMSAVTKALRGFSIQNYMDDVIAASSSWESHLVDLQALFTELQRFGFTINPKKCSFGQKQVKFLGFMVDGMGIKPDPVKVRAMTEFPDPKSVAELKRAMGLLGFYKRFCPNYSALSAPLFEGMKQGKGTKFQWTPEMAAALKSIREILLQNAVLHHPDLNKPFIISTDASSTGISHTISQLDEKGVLRPISFFSQKLHGPQLRWHINEKECFSLVMAFRKNRHLLGNSPIYCVTDNLTTRYIQEIKSSSNAKIMRWALELQRFPFIIKHRPGTQIKVADCLSRIDIPPPSVQEEEECEFDDNDEGIFGVLQQAFDEDPDAVSEHRDSCAAGRERSMHESIFSTAEHSCGHESIFSLQESICSVMERVTQEAVYVRADMRSTSDNDLSVIQKVLNKIERVTSDGIYIGQAVYATLNETSVNGETNTQTQSQSSQTPTATSQTHLPHTQDDNAHLHTHPSNTLPDITVEEYLFQKETEILEAVMMHKDELADEQRTDPFFGPIYRYQVDGSLPRKQRQAKRVLADTDNWLLDDDGLLKKIYKPPRSKDPTDIVFLLALPPRFRRDIVEVYHDSLMGAHQGAPRLLAAIRQKYWWPGQFKDIYQYTQSCDSCQKAKRSRDNTKAPMQTRRVASFMGRIHMDCLHLPKSREGYTVLLVIIDSMSKALELIPCVDETAATLARQFFRCWLLRYSCPIQITTDRHPSFMSNFLKELTKYMGIEKLAISTQHPASNGQVEIMNSHILNTIRALVQRHPMSWPDLLPAVRFGYMTSISKSTKFSPFQLLFGVEPRFPQAYMWNDPSSVPSSTQEAMQSLLPELAYFRKTAHQNLEEANKIHKQAYDARIKAGLRHYEIDDLVLLKDYRIPGTSTDKFSLKFWGPYRITRKFGPVLYELMNTHTYEIVPSLIHQDRLREYNPPNTCRIRQLPRETWEDLGILIDLPQLGDDPPPQPTPPPNNPPTPPPQPTPQPTTTTQPPQHPRRRIIQVTTGSSQTEDITMLPHPKDPTRLKQVTQIMGIRRIGSRPQYKCKITNRRGWEWLYEDRIADEMLTHFHQNRSK